MCENWFFFQYSCFIIPKFSSGRFNAKAELNAPIVLDEVLHVWTEVLHPEEMRM